MKSILEESLSLAPKIIPRRTPRFSRRERQKLGERGHKGLPASCLMLIRQGKVFYLTVASPVPRIFLHDFSIKNVVTVTLQPQQNTTSKQKNSSACHSKA
jgi:hypothetical protein